jgi:hypothetical protein
MVIQVGDQIEQELRRLAGHQGRALADVVEAALRSYIETEAITDIESADIAATQLALLSELPEIEGAEGLPRPSVVNTDNIMTVPRQRLVRLMGQFSSARINELDRALKIALGLDS